MKTRDKAPLFMHSLLCGGVLLLASLSQTDLLAQSNNLEANKNVVRRYFLEMVNNQDLTILDQLVSQNRTAHNLLDGTVNNGTLDDLRKFLTYLFKAFPDLNYTIEDIIAENDLVVTRVVLHGTHKGEFWGYPASNNRIEYLSEIFFMRLENGKIVESWVQFDLHNLFQKLGAKK
jgi:steroid delta-isomerase-like uncharacterized protein